MAGTKLTSRGWFARLGSEGARLRCWHKRQGKEILEFTVQLEILHGESWHAVVRYDNAHGFCHRDTLHPDGTQDKTALFIGDANATFTFAIKELEANWEAHRDRYVGEIKS
jgi:hypothetical protein